MQWSPSKDCGHRGSDDLPWLATFCAYCHTYGQEEAMPFMTPPGQDKTSQTLPYVSLPFNGSTLSPFPVINVTVSIIAFRAFYESFSRFSNLQSVLGTPELALGVRSLGQTWQSGGLCPPSNLPVWLTLGSLVYGDCPINFPTQYWLISTHTTFHSLRSLACVCGSLIL